MPQRNMQTASHYDNVYEPSHYEHFLLTFPGIFMTLRNRNIILAASFVALTGFAFTAQSARTLPFGNPLRISMNA